MKKSLSLIFTLLSIGLCQTQVQITYPYNVTSPILFNLIKSDSGTLTNNTDKGFIRIDADGNYIFTFRW